MQKKAIIIGAGPAGLTAAYELLDKTDIIPIIFESTADIGGISKTVNYKENRIDIGGHRFFSKSDKIINWWLNILPLENPPELNPQDQDDIMLVRSRLSRILFLRKFFDYPISLSWNTISTLGFIRMCKIGLSYIKSSIFQRKEKSLEDFFINRFGYELYSTFFKDYTQKVWGIPCSEIKPEWGSQRIKGLSVAKTILNALKKPFVKSDLSKKIRKQA
jgi:protoporphyrinogen oxidase